MPDRGKRAAFSCKQSHLQSYCYFSPASARSLRRMWGIFLSVPLRYQDDGRQEREAGKDRGMWRGSQIAPVGLQRFLKAFVSHPSVNVLFSHVLHAGMGCSDVLGSSLQNVHSANVHEDI